MDSDGAASSPYKMISIVGNAIREGNVDWQFGDAPKHQVPVSENRREREWVDPPSTNGEPSKPRSKSPQRSNEAYRDHPGISASALVYTKDETVGGEPDSQERRRRALLHHISNSMESWARQSPHNKEGKSVSTRGEVVKHLGFISVAFCGDEP